MSKVTPKNGNVKAPKTDATKEVKKAKKIDYPVKDGQKLAELPKDFDPEKHNPIKKVHFEKSSDHLRHRASICKHRADQYQKQADDFAQKAERMEKFGDEKTAKKLKKVEKLRSTLDDLRAQLTAEGINVDEILSGVAEAKAEAPVSK